VKNKNPLKKAIQIGAGNIGRGFLAQLFTHSGYEVVFVDIDERLISALNKNKSYTIQVIGNSLKKIIINNVRAVNIKEKHTAIDEILNADIMAVAVGVNALEKVAPLIAAGIKLRFEQNIQKPMNIIICENLLNAGKVLKGYIKRHCDCFQYIDNKIGFVESVVSRMIPVVPEEIRKNDPTLIRVEEYCILPVDKKGFKGEIPSVEGMIPYDNLKAYEEQKLFIHNLGHSSFAYFGYLKEYKYIWQAVEDKEINGRVRDILNESGTALIKKHGFTEKEMQEHIEDLFKRFANKSLGDTVYRVGREPIRKLGINDRFIGGAKLVLEYGIEPENICTGIAAALCYDYPEDEQAVKLSSLLKDNKIDEIIKKICQIDPESKLGRLIVNKYTDLI